MAQYSFQLYLISMQTGGISVEAATSNCLDDCL